MLTWGEHGNWVKMSAEGDAVRGPQRLKSAVWYATGATSGTTLLELTETTSATPVTAAVAEAAQLVKALEVPAGDVEGITLSNLDAGYVLLYFEEQAGLSAKGIHDDTPEATA